MNLITHNIGHYRVTDYGRNNQFQLFNRRDDRVYDITQRQYESIRDHMSIAACEFVEAARKQVERQSMAV
jgi:hypothetical protein